MEGSTVKFKTKRNLAKNSPKNFKQVIFFLLIGLVVTGAILFAVYKLGYFESFKVAKQIQKQAQVSAEDTKILEQLSKIFLLPEDVAPTMAIVNDADALRKSQPVFFADAKNGMRLIIYPTQAILFDAEANKIIKVGPVQLADSNKVGQVVFAIYNSTADDGKTTEVEDKIKSTFGNAVISIKEKATHVDYPETTVVDLVGNNPDIDRIAEAVGGKVAPLPEGEKKPEGAAVLVIVGK